MMVDTNVLVYAASPAAPEHRACRERLENLRRQALPWFLTWGIVYEFLRVVTHPRVPTRAVSATEAWSFVEALLASSSLRILGPGPDHARVLAELIAELPDLRGNLFHDAHTAGLMREHGVRSILTRDTDFHRFPSLEVVDPLR